jgi:integrase
MNALPMRYIFIDQDRSGKERIYVRRRGRKIRIREKQGTEAFAQAYADALRALGTDPESVTVTGASAGTLGWLAACYFASAEFRQLAAKSAATRRLIIEECLREPRKPQSSDLMRDCPVSALAPAHIKMLRDRKQSKPGAANNRRKYLSSMFGWAVERGLIRSNPAREIRRLRYASEGFHTWSLADVRQFEARHPIGTKARLALALMLFLGVRRGDVVTLGRQMMRGDSIRIIPSKTRYRRAEASEKPVLPVLADIIAQSPTGDLTLLVTQYGKAFTAAGFGAWFRKRCDEAGLPQCSAHGLRKAGATIAANNGATTPQLMALYDWTSPAQAEPYIRAANRKSLAVDAAQLIEQNISGRSTDPHTDPQPIKSLRRK